MRRHLAIVAVVVLVALAGCSGAMPGDDSSPNDEPNDADQAPTLETVAYPDGYAQTGLTNASQALATHDAAIADAAGYRASASIRVDAGDETQELVLNSTVDNDAGTEFSRLDLAGSVEVYRTANGSTYTRIDDGSNVQYVASRPDAYAQVSIAQFESTLSATNLTATSVSQEGSTTLLTYAGDGSIEGSGDVSIELVVDTEGRIHSLSIDQGADVSADFDFEYGSVTVEQPTWLDDAKAAT